MVTGHQIIEDLELRFDAVLRVVYLSAELIEQI